MTDDPFDIPDFLNRRKGNPMTNTVITSPGHIGLATLADNAEKLAEMVPTAVGAGLLGAEATKRYVGIDPGRAGGDESVEATVTSAGEVVAIKRVRQKRTSAFKVAIEGYVTYNDADPADMARAAALVAEGDVLKLAVHMTDVTVSQTHGRFKGIGG